jgi:hypothetical protein
VDPAEVVLVGDGVEGVRPVAVAVPQKDRRAGSAAQLFDASCTATLILDGIPSAVPERPAKLERISLRTTSASLSTSGPFDPSPGYGPAVSPGMTAQSPVPAPALVPTPVAPGAASSDDPPQPSSAEQSHAESRVPGERGGLRGARAESIGFAGGRLGPDGARRWLVCTPRVSGKRAYPHTRRDTMSAAAVPIPPSAARFPRVDHCCTDCGYRVPNAVPAACPKCGAETWDAEPWRLFSRRSAPE